MAHRTCVIRAAVVRYAARGGCPRDLPAAALELGRSGVREDKGELKEHREHDDAWDAPEVITEAAAGGAMHEDAALFKPLLVQRRVFAEQVACCRASVAW